VTSIESWSESATEQLTNAGVFEFGQARLAIDQMLGSPSNEADRQGYISLQITAAEFSLLPSFLAPLSFSVPLGAPLTVPGWAAVMAVTRGSCALTDPFCFDARNLVTFSGDQLKLRTIPDQPIYPFSDQNAFNQESELSSFIERFEDIHLRGGNAMAATLAESGLLRIQALLLIAKWSLARPDNSVDLRSLAHQVGII
jgi:hypothetical protein